MNTIMLIDFRNIPLFCIFERNVCYSVLLTTSMLSDDNPAVLLFENNAHLLTVEFSLAVVYVRDNQRVGVC